MVERSLVVNKQCVGVVFYLIFFIDKRFAE